MDILNVITSQMNQLTSKEQELAKYILNNSDEVTNLSIVELAEILNVSNATITRFCKKLNVTNFVQLKMELSRSNGKYRRENNQHTVEEEVKAFYLLMIEKTENLMSYSDMNMLVKLIKTSQNIYIFGMGSSGEIGRLLATRLRRMGINAIAITDVDEMLIYALKVSTQDTLLFISKSGETKGLLDALEIVNERKAHSVSLTGYSQSSLSLKTKETFLIDPTGYLNNQEFFCSQLSMYYFLDVLSLKLLEDESLKRQMNLSYNIIKKIKGEKDD